MHLTKVQKLGNSLGITFHCRLMFSYHFFRVLFSERGFKNPIKFNMDYNDCQLSYTYTCVSWSLRMWWRLVTASLYFCGRPSASYQRRLRGCTCCVSCSLALRLVLSVPAGLPVSTSSRSWRLALARSETCYKVNCNIHVTWCLFSFKCAL